MTRRASSCLDEFGRTAAGAALLRFALILAVIAVLIVATAAWPAPPEGADPALAPWFQSLQTKQGGS